MRPLILFFVASLPLLAQTPCKDANFLPGTMDVNSLNSEFKGAILRLQMPPIGESRTPGESGTGFLIDSVNGYVITAYHVVKLANQETQIDVTSPYLRLPAGRLKATFVKSLATLSNDSNLSGTDLAILKLDDPSLVKDIRPVDISLRFPSVDQPLYAMGYPKYSDDLPNTELKQTSPKFMGAPPDGSIEVTDAVFPGNSGGPLMDFTGSVVGTCRDRLGAPSTIAQYVPMSAGKDLLDLVPMSDRMKSLDARFRSGAVSESELKDILVKNSKNPTNLELYSWVRYIIANPNQYAEDSTRGLLRCPLKAASQRGLEDLIVELSMNEAIPPNRTHTKGISDSTKAVELPQHSKVPLVDPKTIGDANLMVAEREVAQGRPLSAENYVHAAAAAFAEADDTFGTYRAAILSTRIQLAVGSIDAAHAQSTKVLAHLDLLPPKDKSEALSVAANIDIAKGNRSEASSRFVAASGYAIAAGQFTTAANLLIAAADASIRLSKTQDARDSLTKAIGLFQETKDTSGEAESVYKLVKVESAVGDKAASNKALQHYLALQPQGTHAAEAKELLASPQSVNGGGVTAVIQ